MLRAVPASATVSALRAPTRVPSGWERPEARWGVCLPVAKRSAGELSSGPSPAQAALRAPLHPDPSAPYRTHSPLTTAAPTTRPSTGTRQSRSQPRVSSPSQLIDLGICPRRARWLGVNTGTSRATRTRVSPGTRCRSALLSGRPTASTTGGHCWVTQHAGRGLARARSLSTMQDRPRPRAQFSWCCLHKLFCT